MKKKILLIILVLFFSITYQKLYELYKFRKQYNLARDPVYLFDFRCNIADSYDSIGCIDIMHKQFRKNILKLNNYQIIGTYKNSMIRFYLLLEKNDIDNPFIYYFLKNRLGNEFDKYPMEISSFLISEREDYTIISAYDIDKKKVKSEISKIIKKTAENYESSNKHYYIDPVSIIGKRQMLRLERDSVSGIISYNVNEPLDYTAELYILQLKHALTELMNKYNISVMDIPILFPFYSEFLPPRKWYLQELKTKSKKLQH